MEKADVKSQEAQSDTSSVINMKEYAPSEYPSSEPPPAYMKPRHNSLRIARLAAFTVIASAIILGGFILAASWIQANTARNLDLTLNQELMDDLHPSYEHLIANEALPEQQDNNINQNNDEDKKSVPQQQQQQQQQQDSQVPNQQEEQDDKPSLDLDAIANMLIQKGMRGKVNCIVEKRRNEELVDHLPRALSLPFGVNITTAPRLQHLTGEQMVVICKDDNEEKEEEEKEDREQPMFIPIPQQLLAQLQHGAQMIPLAHILQHLPQQVQQPQQPIFMPQQQPQEQQAFYHPQPIFHPQPQPQQQMFVPQQQQQQPQQHQQIFRQFFPFFHRNQPQQPEQQQQQPMPLREVPLSQLMQQRMPINPMAVQDVPMSQMPLTHMPMREQRMQEQPIPVHHLVPPRPQQMRVENYGQEEPEIPAFIRQRLMQREREMQPRPLPLEAREPRIMRGPFYPINDNALPDAPREESQPAFPPRFPPGRRFRFPDSPDVQGVSITRIIPIRLEKESSEEDNNDNAPEVRPFPSLPMNTILETVLKMIGHRSNSMPIDIKIERIENKGMMDGSSESDESDEGDSEANQEESGEDAKQDEIVDKQADSREAQMYKMEDVPDVARAFLPSAEHQRGIVYPIPQVPEAQIFTVSDARDGVAVRGDYQVSNDKMEATTTTEAPAMAQPEGEINLFPFQEQSVRLLPVVEGTDKPQEDMKMEQGEQAEESRPHTMQPRSV